MEKKIKGKLFFSKQLKNILRQIDTYEGSEYKRSITNVYFKDGSSVESYIYEALKLSNIVFILMFKIFKIKK